jgi:hypothetical protein
MDIEKFERDIGNYYGKRRSKDLQKKILGTYEHMQQEWGVGIDELNQHQLKVLSKKILDIETKSLHDELQDALVEKERIERLLERKREELQDAKYRIFDAFEAAIGEESPALEKLHHIKLQCIDLFDMLQEMVESAILTTLEKGYDIEETIEEITKEITFETLSEGSFSSIRIRQVMSNILTTSVEIADATPNRAEEIIKGTMKGLRAGFVKSINHFKKQLLFMPDEIRSSIMSDPSELRNELQRSDLLFTQMVQNLAQQSSSSSKAVLEKVSKEMHYDLEELLQISKETVDIMKEKFSKAVSKSSMLNSQTAKEAKRMGTQAWASAKAAMSNALRR